MTHDRWVLFIVTTIRLYQEIHCLPYAGFLLLLNQTFLERHILNSASLLCLFDKQTGLSVVRVFRGFMIVLSALGNLLSLRICVFNFQELGLKVPLGPQLLAAA